MYTNHKNLQIKQSHQETQFESLMKSLYLFKHHLYIVTTSSCQPFTQKIQSQAA